MNTSGANCTRWRIALKNATAEKKNITMWKKFGDAYLQNSTDLLEKLFPMRLVGMVWLATRIIYVMYIAFSVPRR